MYFCNIFLLPTPVLSSSAECNSPEDLPVGFRVISLKIAKKEGTCRRHQIINVFVIYGFVCFGGCYSR